MGRDGHSAAPRVVPFNSFTVPACRKCNGESSELEGRAKVVMVDLLADRSVSAEAMSDLLSWFDKVRIGLWLMDMAFTRNVLGVAPKFFVTQRIAAEDRMLQILRSSDASHWLEALCVQSPCFGLMPSCFGLAVNDLFFLNMSCEFLFGASGIVCQ